MKNRSKPIIIIILIAVILLLIPACDVLISPLKARTNPNDPNTTIQPPENVDVNFNTVNDELGLDITWNWSNEGSESEVIGFVVIRKVGAAPTSVYDGICSYVSNSTEDGYYFDTIDGNPDYPKGHTIYYAVYSYASKWDTDKMREEEKLSLDSDGTVRNLQNYNFNGPIVDLVDVWASKDMPVTEDGYVDNLGKNTSDNNFLVASTTPEGATALGCISFDISSPPEGSVKITDIYLVLRTYNDGGSGSIVVSPFTVDWTDGVNDDFVTLENDPTAVDNLYDVDLSINGGPNEQLWLKVTDIYEAWTDGSLTNYGFRLIKQELADLSWQFFTVEDGDAENNWPKLRVFYLYE